MKKYIALLRGVNVGGKNRIVMKELKKLFEDNGFQDVSTYINSGNIIFSTDLITIDRIQSRCENMILEKFCLEIAVAVISAEATYEALRNAPDWWGHDEESKHNAIFVIPPDTVEKIFHEVGEIKPEYEKVGYYHTVIFWSAPIKTFSRTRWSKVVGTTAYQYLTIRNANTIKKLVALCYQDGT
jgi:uncharacterized protein (DUF1697 family)